MNNAPYIDKIYKKVEKSGRNIRLLIIKKVSLQRFIYLDVRQNNKFFNFR